ncbi:MAG: hypothetical protein ABH821_02935 [archaeon]
MKIMIFVDFDNFCKSIERKDAARKERIKGFPDFIIDFLNKRKLLKLSQNELIRTYMY